MKRHLRLPEGADIAVICSAASVCLFEYQTAWVDVGIEGTLTLYRSAGSAAVRLYLPDKKSLRVFSLELAPGTESEYHERFVIVREGSSSSCLGLWFNDERGAARVFRALSHTG
ncbi:hypothetical protein PAPHI01_0760 [Pancytospora philotis]|nr:hypothetical protein PAPHI01_0760 [Pancytospora philotis]